MTPLQEKLLDALQQGIEIVARPYEELAARLAVSDCHAERSEASGPAQQTAMPGAAGCHAERSEASGPTLSFPRRRESRPLGVSEAQVLSEIARLKEDGLIRRFRGQIDYRALGRVAVLVAAAVPPDRLDVAAAAVNALPGVSHNYLRDHAFNLWFTLQDRSLEQIDAVLSGLSRRLGIEFHSLPAERIFKLDVRFHSGPDSSEPDRPAEAAEVKAPARPADLSDLEKQALRFIQREFPVVSDPFARAEGLDEQACLDAARSLRDKGVLKRIAAVVNHYKLGYLANGMFCALVPPDQIEPAALRLAAYKQVSHCYQRRPFPGWPYNLFAMIHAQTGDLLAAWTRDFAHTMKIDDFVVLKTLRELKKDPVLLDFSD
jgi:DNA-binding Lrp family transcriptional regulator